MRRPRPRARIVAWLLLAAAVLALLLGLTGTSETDGRLRTLSHPFRASQQTLLTFGTRSHWLQPWRGYQQTVPARRLLDALGAVFNPAPEQADAVAAKLESAGFHRARLEIGWCSVAPGEPPRLADRGRIATLLGALRRHRLRPLVLLNANESCPGPLSRFQVRVTAPARAGDRTLRLDRASLARVVPGRTGLDSTSDHKAAATLFTDVSGDAVTLSRPLDRDLAPGSYAATTLEYAPFRRPGEPGFERTLDGWLEYAGLVTRTVASILGSTRFDVEIWNELTFGSGFLDANTYYDPPVAAGDPRETQRAILERTVAYLRDPAHGVAGIGIGDGFSNERPWESGATVPAGLTAIDKHPYVTMRRFPVDSVFNEVRPLDALGRPDGWRDSAGHWHDAFVPRYTAFFPEYYLSGIQTENLVRDLSPITTDVFGTPHGRHTHRPGAPPPAMWLTEAGLDLDPVPPPVRPRLKAKELLRWAAAWVNRGAAAVYLYSTSQKPWSIVDPGAPGGGQALRAARRLTATLSSGAARITRPRSPRLAAVAGRSGRAQFAGDGSARHPPLYDRDVLAFFPYQVANGRVVVATYVMTRNLLRSYRPRLSRSNPARYDMPPERFRLTIRNLGGLGRHVAATDPLTGRRVPVHVVSRSRDRLVVQLGLTDSPRLLSLS